MTKVDLQRIIDKKQALNKSKYSWKRPNPNYKPGGPKYIYGYKGPDLTANLPKKEKRQVESVWDAVDKPDGGDVVSLGLQRMHFLEKVPIDGGKLRSITGDDTIPMSIKTDEEVRTVADKIRDGIRSGKIDAVKVWTYIDETRRADEWNKRMSQWRRK